MPAIDSWRHVGEVLAVVLADLSPLRLGASPRCARPGAATRAGAAAPARRSPEDAGR